MTPVGDLEAATQRRVVARLHGLGYTYLGDWRDRPDNRNIEPDHLTSFLKRQGHSPALITRALDKLDKAAALGGSKSLYDANRDVYGLLRYGAKVRPGLGEHTVTVNLVDWEHPAANDFAFAEEVTVSGRNAKRPDIVLYVNGIAVGVIELKRSTVSVAEGIRQNLDSQKREFIRPFFTTVQLLMAGNETEGLRYGVIGTPEKHWLRWKEAGADAGAPAADAPGADAPSSVPTNPLLAELGHLCAPERLLEIVHDFVVFDAGTKKVCRHNQYFGVKAAQSHVRRREGGIVWHTQGSGKSLTMVWLAKWIRELGGTDGRVLIVTDRTELDEQIEMVFRGVDEDIHRTTSGADLAKALRDPAKSLICSLVHKFGVSDEGNIDRYVSDLRAHMRAGAAPPGEVFVFVDECHRTQSGKLHRAMKAILPGATLIGFTGTPLLRADKRRSVETFGPYIHTYKYDEAVDDGVVLDLRYEGAGHRPGHHVGGEDRPVVRRQDEGPESPGPGAAPAAVGHHAEGHELSGPHSQDRRRHHDGHGDARSPRQRARQRHARVRQRLRGLPLLRGLQRDRTEGQVRHRDLVQPGRRGHQGRGDRRGRHRTAPQARCLSENARRPLRRARGQGHAQGRAVRARGQSGAS